MLAPFAIFILVIIGSYIAFLKIACRVLSYHVSWRSILLFALTMMVIVILAQLLDLQQPIGIIIGHRIFVVLGLIALGGWFFSKRGKDRSGALLGWVGGAKLVGLTFTMIFLLAFAIVLPAKIFLGSHLPPR
jgi:hypothetical protein